MSTYYSGYQSYCLDECKDWKQPQLNSKQCLNVVKCYEGLKGKNKLGIYYYLEDYRRNTVDE